MAKALFFGRLRDKAGGGEREVALSAPLKLAQFMALLGEDAEALAAELGAPSVRVAINAIMTPPGGDPLIQPGDEVAFMPPFSGG